MPSNGSVFRKTPCPNPGMTLPAAKVSCRLRSLAALSSVEARPVHAINPDMAAAADTAEFGPIQQPFPEPSPECAPQFELIRISTS